jgi:hypothetical protein
MEYQTKEMPVLIEMKDVGEDGSFTGLASTFGGKPDSYGDTIANGAFVDTIAKGGYGGNGIKMLWQHDRTKPIGVWTEMVETKKGLQVKGQIAINTSLGRDAYELLKIGAINAMSIGFDSVEAESTKTGRLFKKVELYEVSLVTFPANTGARITGVKSYCYDDLKDIKDVRALEGFLRDAGFSRDAAKTLISICKKKTVCDAQIAIERITKTKNMLEEING